MNMRYEIFGDLPPMNLSTDELTKIMISIFAKNPGDYSFAGFANYISSHLRSTGQGFESAPNTNYTGGLCQADQSRVREIIWDLIVVRYLTIGGNGYHDWPNFTVTERGKEYFQKIQENNKL